VSYELKNIGKTVDGDIHLDDISWATKPGQFNTLLGPTLSGKTSIMRILAGLDKPTSGVLSENGADISNVPVKKRSVAMVYQQFINYPGFSVRDNIVSPLRNQKLTDSEIEERLERVTSLLKLGDYLARKPLELSGGQQQRVALARALAKQSDLILLDEPLANLDYKLREELRSELPKLFSGTNSTVVYATTEPEEALLLGGNVAVIDTGRLIESGPVLELYKTPGALACAMGLSDPPLNILPVEKKGDYFVHQETSLNLKVPEYFSSAPDGCYNMALRPHHLAITDDNPVLTGSVKSADITGSETYVHMTVGGNDWTLLKHGIHTFKGGSSIGLTFDAHDMMLFDQNGNNLALIAAKAA
jgi:glycerol transport system ATP-binding protein